MACGRGALGLIGSETKWPAMYAFVLLLSHRGRRSPDFLDSPPPQPVSQGGITIMAIRHISQIVSIHFCECLSMFKVPPYFWASQDNVTKTYRDA